MDFKNREEIVKEKLLELEKQYEEAPEWKKRQLTTKIYEFKKKHFPNVFWSGKAQYRKKKGE